MTAELLQRAREIATAYLDGVADRRVGSLADYSTLVAQLGGELGDIGDDPRTVIERLARDADPGLVATAGPRYFGFVIGGALPVTVAADWLTTAWDQNAFSFATSPAAAAVE